MVYFRLAQYGMQVVPCSNWRDLKADIVSICSALPRMLKGLEVLTDMLILGRTGVICVIAGIFSKG